MFKVFFTTLYYELLLFGRERKLVLHSLGFYFMVALLFPLALSPHPELLQKFAAGILWVAAFLACLLALENWLRTDLDDQALELLLLSIHPLPWLLAAKMLAFWLVVALPLILMTPLMGLLFHLPGSEVFWLALSLLAGTPALIAVGATCKALTLSLQQQGALLGLLVLPLCLPVLMMGIDCLLQLQLSLPVSGSLAFLAALSLLGFCFLPLALAFALRAGME